MVPAVPHASNLPALRSDEAVPALSTTPETAALLAVMAQARAEPISIVGRPVPRMAGGYDALRAKQAMAAYGETLALATQPMHIEPDLELPQYGVRLGGGLAARARAQMAEDAARRQAEAEAAAKAESFSIGDMLRAIFSGLAQPAAPTTAPAAAPVTLRPAAPAAFAPAAEPVEVKRPIRLDVQGQQAKPGRTLRAGPGMNPVFLLSLEELIRRSDSGRWLLDRMGPDSVTVAIDNSLPKEHAGLVVISDGDKPAICLAPTQDIGQIVSTLVHECKHVIDIAATEQAFESTNPLDHLMLRRVAEGMADTMAITVAMELKRAGVREPYLHLARYVDTSRMIEAYEAEAVRGTGTGATLAAQRASCMAFLNADGRRDETDRHQLTGIKMLAAHGHFSPASPVSSLTEAQLEPFGATGPHGNCWRHEADRLTMHRATLDRGLSRDVADMVKRVHAFGAQHAAAGKPPIRPQQRAG